jgi:hypothetical protein
LLAIVLSIDALRRWLVSTSSWQPNRWALCSHPAVSPSTPTPGNYYLSFLGKANNLGQFGIQVPQYGILVSEVGVSVVPVPAAAWLLGSGLIGLAGVIRRKSA